LIYGQFLATGAAEDSLLAKLKPLPNPGRVASLGFMTIVARIVSPAAFELDGNNIELAAIMGTAGTRVYVNAMNLDPMNDHLHSGKGSLK
jgi:hypothetical protein